MQHKVHWSRAARTDKGVHALGNVVSLKLMCPADVDMVAEINKKLPGVCLAVEDRMLDRIG